MTKENTRNDDCTPLTRVYYSQYQYMPFYIASLAVFYYVPYIMYRVVNSDVIALKKDIVAPTESDTPIEKGASHVANTYFRYGFLLVTLVYF